MTAVDVPQRQPDSRRVRARYVLMLIHFALILSTLVQSFVQGNNALALLIHSLGLAAFCVYIPAAAYLCHIGRSSSFDHAAGEVAYVAVQSAIWSFSTATAFLAIALSNCTELLPPPPELGLEGAPPPAARTRWLCSRFLVTAVLSAAHVALLLCWLVWVVLEARRARGGFKMSMGALLRGERK